MSDIVTITASNVDNLCGPVDATEFEFSGHVRKLCFRSPMLGYGICCATPIEDVVKLIPRDEWVDRIREKDAADSWLELTARKFPSLDQNGLSYCHAYGTARALEVTEHLAGRKHVALSAESMGGIVTGWRNEGADPNDDLQVAIERGVCEASFMDKPYSLRPSRWQDGWQQNALQHRVAEFFDLRVPGKEFDAVVTACLLGFPGGLGYEWWSHFISGPYRVRYNEKSRKFEILNQNNWGPDWPTEGADGYAWFEEGTGRSQGTPDWAFCIRAMKPQTV